MENSDKYHYRQEFPNKNGYFYLVRFLFKSYITGKRWQINLTYILQFFIGFPLALCLDLIIETIKILIKIIRFILNEIKVLFSKLIYDFLKAIIRPFAVLVSIFAFSLIIYSLIKDYSIIQTLSIIYQKLF